MGKNGNGFIFIIKGFLHVLPSFPCFMPIKICNGSVRWCRCKERSKAIYFRGAKVSSHEHPWIISHLVLKEGAAFTLHGKRNIDNNEFFILFFYFCTIINRPSRFQVTQEPMSKCRAKAERCKIIRCGDNYDPVCGKSVRSFSSSATSLILAKNGNKTLFYYSQERMMWLIKIGVKCSWQLVGKVKSSSSVPASSLLFVNILMKNVILKILTMRCRTTFAVLQVPTNPSHSFMSSIQLLMGTYLVIFANINFLKEKALPSSTLNFVL